MDMNRNDLFIPAEEIHFLLFSFFFLGDFLFLSSRLIIVGKFLLLTVSK